MIILRFQVYKRNKLENKENWLKTLRLIRFICFSKMENARKKRYDRRDYSVCKAADCFSSQKHGTFSIKLPSTNSCTCFDECVGYLLNNSQIISRKIRQNKYGWPRTRFNSCPVRVSVMPWPVILSAQVENGDCRERKTRRSRKLCLSAQRPGKVHRHTKRLRSWLCTWR